MKELLDQLHRVRQTLGPVSKEDADAVSKAIRILESRIGRSPADFTAFQSESLSWATECFGPEAPFDREERRNRFMEEALELFQASGGNTGEVLKLTDYVYGRPIGKVDQEAGGVILTLSLLCTANEVNLQVAALAELARVYGKIKAIRAKQAARPEGSPLPGPDQLEENLGA